MRKPREISIVPSPFQIYPDTYVPLLKRSFEGDPIIDRFVRDMQRPQKLVAEIRREADIPFQDLMPTFLEHNAAAFRRWNAAAFRRWRGTARSFAAPESGWPPLPPQPVLVNTGLPLTIHRECLLCRTISGKAR